MAGKTPMERVVAKMDDQELDKEIGFARGFNLTDPAAIRWLEVLQAEKAKRTS